MLYLSNIYDRLFDSFIDNARQWIIELEEGLLQLEKSPCDKELVNNIFRIAHNIKSTSGIVGLNDIYRFANNVEDVLQLIRQGNFSPTKELIDAILKAADLMWLMVESAVSELSFDFSECENWMKNMETLRDGGL
jgi:two-component system chemotaxis sensor kinase CheA